MTMKIKSDFSGLEELQRRARELGGTRSIPLTELMPPSFIAHHTGCADIDDLARRAGIDPVSQEAFEAGLPSVDAWLQQHTRVASWQDLLQVAAADYCRRQLGL